MSQFNEAGRAAQRAEFRWDIPPPRASRCFGRVIITVATEAHTTAADGTFRCDMQASGSTCPDFERLKFQGAGGRLAAMRQPLAGSVLEPAHPETASNTPRYLKSTILQPDVNPWDFDGCE
jgi:hypothetical protein